MIQHSVHPQGEWDKVYLVPIISAHYLVHTLTQPEHACFNHLLMGQHPQEEPSVCKCELLLKDMASFPKFPIWLHFLQICLASRLQPCFSFFAQDAKFFDFAASIKS
mmetsp:Transcript_18510/g.40071  ORF Transcript_18510/g.40071 Transcript_18510/m.40071 type:complete len:107 (+) Transcript_18510:107-427(+)